MMNDIRYIHIIIDIIQDMNFINSKQGKAC